MYGSNNNKETKALIDRFKRTVPRDLQQKLGSVYPPRRAKQSSTEQQYIKKSMNAWVNKQILKM